MVVLRFIDFGSRGAGGGDGESDILWVRHSLCGSDGECRAALRCAGEWLGQAVYEWLVIGSQ